MALKKCIDLYWNHDRQAILENKPVYEGHGKLVLRCIIIRGSDNSLVTWMSEVVFYILNI